MTFLILFGCSNSIREECWATKYVVVRQINMTILSEILSLIAYFTSAFAYACHKEV